MKIGYTTNLKSRLASLALRREDVLLALEGGPDLERALHTHFAADRNGSTEWFDLSPEIFRYVTASHPQQSVESRQDGRDELLARARRDFPAGASVRALKSRYRIGQAKAQNLRKALAA